MSIPPQPDSPLISKEVDTLILSDMNYEQRIPQDLSLPNTNHLVQPSIATKKVELNSSNESAFSSQNVNIVRGVEPPPPTTSFLHCGCIKATLKFGIPFICVVALGAMLNWLLKADETTKIIGAFVQTWIPIVFILFYLRWRYFRVVLTIELLIYFFLSLVCIFPYGFGLVYLSVYVTNKWNVFDQTISQWLTLDRFLMLCANSFILVSFAMEVYKIVFLWFIYKRKIIACPTALIIYSIVISSSSSSCIEALYIINQESIWVGILIILISLPINIATGIYEAMYFSTLRFANKEHQTRPLSVDSMDVTIEYNTEKNKMSSKFTFASHSPSPQKHKRKIIDENGHKVPLPSSLTTTETDTAARPIYDFYEADMSYHNNSSLTNLTYNHENNNYCTGDTDKTHGKKYIVNFDKKNVRKTVFRAYLMFMICWISHSIVQLLMVFIDALFRECYPTEIFLKDINDGKEDGILCTNNTIFWLLLLWILVIICFIISLSFIGYIRHLWLLYFKDGTKINIHYLLMCNQINLPKCIQICWCCCKCCYFCEVNSVFDEYGVLLSSVRDKRLSTNEEKQYQKMKQQLDNIT